MINTGIFPNKLKWDYINLLTNYRPISLLHVIFNLLKTWYLNSYISSLIIIIFYNSQYEFRQYQSTLELVDIMTLGIDNMNTPVNILYDLSKALNTLNHQILLLSLKHIESYLSNRT